MSNRFWTPTRKGTELFPAAPQGLPQIFISGTSGDDPQVQELFSVREGQINQFVYSSRENYSISTLNFYNQVIRLGDFSVQYTNNYGQERIIVTLLTKKEEKEEKEPEGIIDDIMLDGYIGIIWNAQNQIDNPVTEITSNVVKFDKVWVYVPGYTPPGGYSPNGNFYVEVPSLDGTSYGVMDFNVWYSLARLEWVRYNPSVGLGLEWVGPDSEKYVHDGSGNFPFVINSYVPGNDYTVAVHISDVDEVHLFYQLDTGSQPIPAIGPEYHNKVPVRFTLNGNQFFEYTPITNETKVFIFRFGNNACRSHSYRDDITKEVLDVTLLNPVLPPRQDSTGKLKQLLSANCGLDKDFWHGHFQVYDNYTGAGINPVEIVDMGVYDLDLIRTGVNIVTAEFTNPPQSTTYSVPASVVTNDPQYERADSVGQITMFAEFFSRNPADFRLVNQSWHYEAKEGQLYRVNDKPKYFFVNPNIYDLPDFDNLVFTFVDGVFNNPPGRVGINVTAWSSGLDTTRYLFNKKTPRTTDKAIHTVQIINPEKFSTYSDFSFEFDLSENAPNTRPATRNLPDGYNETIDVLAGSPLHVDVIFQPFQTGLQPTTFNGKLLNVFDQTILASPYGMSGQELVAIGFEYLPNMSQNVWHNDDFVSNDFPDVTYWYKDEVENGISDWLLFVRSLMPSYIFNGDYSTTHPQAEEAFVKEGS